MSEDHNDKTAADPKERMREALERKNAAQHRSSEGNTMGGKAASGPHGPMGGKRTFRRKAGG